MNECGVLHKYRPYDKAPYVSGSAELGNSVMTSKFTNDIRQFLFGLNGLLAFYGADKYFYLNENDTSTQPFISIKGQTDIPGVLATGSVNAWGGQAKLWGAKKSTAKVTKNGAGIYNVPHTIGHDQYTVSVTPHSADVIAAVTLRGDNSFQVTIKLRSSGSNTDASGFDYVLYGHNG